MLQLDDRGRDALRELGEWMALGFYEAQVLPWPQAYGRAFRRLYENMEIVVYPDRLLVPCEPLPRARTMASHGNWTATSLICDFDHNRGLRVNRDLAADRQQRFPQHAAFIAALADDLERQLPHFGGYTHSNPDIRRVVGEGFLAMRADLARESTAVQQELAHAPADGPRARELLAAQHLFAALDDYTEGVLAFHARTRAALQAAADAAEGPRRSKLQRLAAAFATAFLQPAGSFLEGLLAVHTVWMLDGHDSIGRLDQALGPLFEADLAAGRLDLDFARELLDELWQNFERFNGWNLQIGGYTPAGDDGCNRLTRECLEACRRNRLRRPNVAFRITPETPDEAVAQAVGVLADGSGRPALYNDAGYVQALRALDLGLTPEDAREVGFGGCTETMIAGLSNVGSLDGELNLAAYLVRALHDGYDPQLRLQAGPHTGRLSDFADFDAFHAAVKRQISYATDELVVGLRQAQARRFTAGDPKLCRTFFTRDCVKRRKSFEAGGARYNWSVISYQGIANLIDGLYAIRQAVFETRQTSAAELLAALVDDFKGHEALRRQLQALPKFGNNHPEVDALGRDVIRHAWQELLSHNTARGGRFLPSCILFTTYYRAGLSVGATPDGRRAGEVLTDSVGPAQGRDLKGPTAMLNSVTALPLELAIGTPVLNLRLAKPVLRSAEGVRATVQLIRTFFSQGGLQIQLSVLDREELLAAQREPELHRDLIVRIGGYSEYFTRLDRALQDSVIARTEHR